MDPCSSRSTIYEAIVVIYPASLIACETVSYLNGPRRHIEFHSLFLGPTRGSDITTRWFKSQDRSTTLAYFWVPGFLLNNSYLTNLYFFLGVYSKLGIIPYIATLPFWGYRVDRLGSPLPYKGGHLLRSTQNPILFCKIRGPLERGFRGYIGVYIWFRVSPNWGTLGCLVQSLV